MGNYETLKKEQDPIYYLLKTKCAYVAKEIGIPEGELIFMRNPNLK